MEIPSIDPAPLVEDLALGTPRDKLIYIYTSGTTGMPKAAVITNLRYDTLIASVSPNTINNLFVGGLVHFDFRFIEAPCCSRKIIVKRGVIDDNRD